jgi:preprotein translocase subunit YajC
VKITAIIAQAPDGAAPPAGGDPAKGQPPGAMGILGNPLFMFALLGLFFLVVMLPAQRRQKREAAAKLAAMKVGAKIVTTSGIVGRIITMKDGEDEVVIKSDDTKLRILRTAIASATSDDTPATESKG